ncbi:hypothetical protein ACP4OV_023653 [Aristida adscensionis]
MTRQHRRRRPCWIASGRIPSASQSTRPPSPPPLPSAAGGGHPSWVLLNHTAYLAACPNASAATSLTRDGHEIHASLCIARPPSVSYLCVHCPALTPSHFGIEPYVIATAGGGLIFFRAAVCDPSATFEHAMHDFFVYQLDDAGKGPSLTLLPHPPATSPPPTSASSATAAAMAATSSPCSTEMHSSARLVPARWRGITTSPASTPKPASGARRS